MFFVFKNIKSKIIFGYQRCFPIFFVLKNRKLFCVPNKPLANFKANK